ncbi:MAG: aconitase X [Nitrososphaera sp.]
MQLTRSEDDALSGKHGESLASAYRILVAIGEATDAERLVPIMWAHVSGVNYNTIGNAGVGFLKNFAISGRVTVRTTINPMGYDRTKPEGISEKFRENQMSIARSYEKMGVTPSFTCTPYEIFDIPERGSPVSFAESNAAVFSNSVLGLMTNKESALSALASSITGKAPLSDLRASEARNPKVTIRPDFTLETELDYGLLGYFAGRAVEDSCVALEGIDNPSTMQTKALSAGMGTSGSCGMFTPGDAGGDRISFGREEAKSLVDELSTADDGDLITLGSPQLGIGELELLLSLLDGKKFTKRCMIFCSRAIHNQAAKVGLTDSIERSGAELMCDSCTCLTPYVSKAEYDAVIANSVKAAYYLNNSNKVKVALKDIRTIVKEYSE